MNPTALLAIAILEKLFQYGIPATLKILNDWGIENPTATDIQGLRDLKPPQSYFDNPPVGGDNP